MKTHASRTQTAPQTAPVLGTTTQTQQEGTWGWCCCFWWPWGAHKNTETAPWGPMELNGADGADGADRADRSTEADPHANTPHARPHAHHQTPPRDLLGCRGGRVFFE